MHHSTTGLANFIRVIDARPFLFQVSFAFRHIEGALNYFVDNLDKFSGLAAESERLDALLTGADLLRHEARHPPLPLIITR
jgi:ABC-type uncharacterized transport system fused permease/ATPase subunit